MVGVISVRTFLKITSGQYLGKVVQLETGDSCRVGRAGNADLVLADDEQLAPIHFAVTCTDEAVDLFDWGSPVGTFNNGIEVTRAVLAHGDVVRAGRTTFAVFNETGVFDETPTLLTRLLDILSNENEPLFALLDAARDPMVLSLLADVAEEHQSLYNGETAEELAEVAPYLVSLPPGSQLLKKLLYHGWGKSWGVYFTCSASFEETRRHLRSLQFIEDEQGEELYFRYYDPRVLRTFLPTCTPQEANQFFGPVKSFWVEQKEPTNVLKFTVEGQLAIDLTTAE